MKTSYQTDVIAWANEQAALLRMGKFDELDLEHLAEEIEDVGKSEQRELASRMAVLLAHLLKWQHQPERQGASWQTTIKAQRRGVARALIEAPSLKAKIMSETWIAGVWDDALAQAIKETGLDSFPEVCPWNMDDVLQENWLPS